MDHQLISNSSQSKKQFSQNQLLNLEADESPEIISQKPKSPKKQSSLNWQQKQNKKSPIDSE